MQKQRQTAAAAAAAGCEQAPGVRLLGNAYLGEPAGNREVSRDIAEQ